MSPALQADAAALRRAFNAFATAYQAGSLGRMSPAQRAIWQTLYEAVRDSNAGLKVLAEIERLRERVTFGRLELSDTDAALWDTEQRYEKLRNKLAAWWAEKGERVA